MPMRWPDIVHAAPADHAACRALLCDGSRSFMAASLFLPLPMRDAATALYGFCRLADDAVDLTDDRQRALGQLQHRLDRIYAGQPEAIAADRAFADMVERFMIPRELPEALLEGFAWDTDSRRYANLAELEAYAVRVAGTVGVMMALLMGVRDEGALARACDLGVAMQLTNIARDVGEDARAGRLYLPLDWLAAAGIDADAFLRAPCHTPALGGVVGRLLQAAEHHYQRAEAGIDALPARCRPGIRAARWLYAEIGREVERCDLDAVTTRAVVPGWRKAQVLLRVFSGAACTQAALEAAPVPSARFLVEAAVAAAHEDGVTGSQGRIEERVGWLVELFHRLDDRERMQSGGRQQRNADLELSGQTR
jgi:phytoene synthase